MSVLRWILLAVIWIAIAFWPARDPGRWRWRNGAASPAGGIYHVEGSEYAADARQARQATRETIPVTGRSGIPMGARR